MDSSAKSERQNPYKTASIFSRLVLKWVLPILQQGSKGGLHAEDLPKCLDEDNSTELGDRLEAKWHNEVTRAKRRDKKPRLYIALLKLFWRSALVDGIINLIFILISCFNPLILAQLLIQIQEFETQIKPKNGTINTNNELVPNITQLNVSTKATGDIAETKGASLIEQLWTNVYILGLMLTLSLLFGCFLICQVKMRQRLLGARMRIACCSLIYRKTLRLSMKSAGGTSVGYIVNLLSNDVNRLDDAFVFAHWIWLFPIPTAIVLYMLWARIGIAALVGVLTMILACIPIQTLLGKLISKFRLKIAERTDARVGIMNEIVQGIQVIKMYGWEKPFETLIAAARRREVRQIRHCLNLTGFFSTTINLSVRLTIYMTMVAAILLGNNLSADIVFSAMLYFRLLHTVLGINYPYAISMGAEALVSLKRIQTFLLVEERVVEPPGVTHEKRNDSSDNLSIKLQDVNASWDSENTPNTLQEINLHIQQGQLCALIGSVGAGKSSILQLILGELPIIDGNVALQGELSYAAQEPWLFNGSVRDNILCGEEYNSELYKEVTECCALTKDFKQLSHGDRTIVGERGASLSGGQRARINLARAVYKRADIYLLDDPLSAVDAHVGRHLFDEVIGPNGRLANEKATRILITHQVHFLSNADWIVIVDKGRILQQGTYSELMKSNIDFAKLLERQKTEVSISKNELSKFIDTPYEDDIPYIDEIGDGGYLPLRRHSTLTHKSVSTEKDLDSAEETPEDQGKGGISIRVWVEYIRAASSLTGLTCFVFIVLLNETFCSGSNYFLNTWSQQEYLRSINQPYELSTSECMYIYGAFIIAIAIFVSLRGIVFVKGSMQASKALHDRMFSSLLRASTRFFDLNPSGRVLNRFSKDMGAIDEFLPRKNMDFLQVGSVVFGSVAVLCLVNPTLIIAILFAIIVITLISKLYLRPSQDLKRLEGICRSPVFSYMSATLSGLSTIRSRALQSVVTKEFDDLQNVHSSAWHLTIATSVAYGLWLDFVSCSFLTIVTYSFILLIGEIDSGTVGLAITQTILLVEIMQLTIRFVAESIQQTASLERILEYTELEPESENNKTPPIDWPAQGQIEFRNLSCHYDPNGPSVLKQLNLVIEAGWKVGIVGRTGAGKSSLIAALFRLAHIDGDICIDGIETGEISLASLRKKISIIPQDPVLFTATVRYNLDPFDKYSDADLWNALENVELKSAVLGLNMMITERGSNFSVGQRQLLCLARAVLRNNKVLVLDEATANVDPHTDSLIQRTIRDKFKHCTVLTIAHRLHTVMDSDRIVVMDAGSICEFDIPHLLLKKTNGMLLEMVEATGKESDALKRIASDAYEKNCAN